MSVDPKFTWPHPSIERKSLAERIVERGMARKVELVFFTVMAIMAVMTFIVMFKWAVHQLLATGVHL
jgi:flagellar biogenesis protein FliO